MSEEYDEDNDPFIAKWVLFVKNPNFSLIEKCLKMAQLLEYPELSVDKCIKKINDVGKSIIDLIPDSKNPKYLISLLNEEFFNNGKFKGDIDDYYNPKNNFLNEVIEKKSGLPITLSILYVEFAKQLGLDLKIVGFPGHIVVKLDEEVIIDPFNGGRLLDVDDLQNILDRNFGGEVELSPEFLNEITPKMILTRIARNLKNSYAQSYDYNKSKQCVDMVLALEPDSPEEIK